MGALGEYFPQLSTGSLVSLSVFVEKNVVNGRFIECFNSLLFDVVVLCNPLVASFIASCCSEGCGP